MATDRGAPRSNTPRLNLPYPEPENAADVPLWIRDLCNRLEDILLSNGLDGEPIVPGTPVGSVVAWTSPSPPAGWALCNGQVYDRIQYDVLYAVCGDRFAGTASEPVNPSNFAVPNLVGRVIEHSGVQGIGHHYPDVRGVRVPKHTHGMDHYHGMNGHVHGIGHEHSWGATTGGASGTAVSRASGTAPDNALKHPDHVHGVGGVTSGGPAHSGGPNIDTTTWALWHGNVSRPNTDQNLDVDLTIMQPTAVLPYIIRIK